MKKRSKYSKFSSTRFILASSAFVIFTALGVWLLLKNFKEAAYKLFDWSGYVVVSYIGLRTVRGAVRSIFDKVSIAKQRTSIEEEVD